MHAFQWNALRVGDEVCVHDDLAFDLELHTGVVVLVQTYQREVNDVGIRLDSDSGAVVHPRRHAVHLGGGGDAQLGCWRCEAEPGAAA